ncbi:MAG: hypothetical protein ACK41Q_10910 [Candidatus Brocadia sp.]
MSKYFLQGTIGLLIWGCSFSYAELKAAVREAECQKCKEVRARPVKGKTLATWEMKCPDCKHKPREWLIQHCDTCDADFIACPH